MCHAGHAQHDKYRGGRGNVMKNTKSPFSENYANLIFGRLLMFRAIVQLCSGKMEPFPSSSLYSQAESVRTEMMRKKLESLAPLTILYRCIVYLGLGNVRLNYTTIYYFFLSVSLSHHLGKNYYKQK